MTKAYLMTCLMGATALALSACDSGSTQAGVIEGGNTSASIQGRLLTPSGVPAAAKLRLRPAGYRAVPSASDTVSWPYLTDSTGRFQIPGADSGSYLLEASQDTFAWAQPVHVDANDANIALLTDTLQHSAILRGHLTIDDSRSESVV